MATSTDNVLFTPWNSSTIKSNFGHMQSIMNYCASRFRAAAMSIANRTDMTIEQSQIHVALFGRELVCLSISFPRHVNRCDGLAVCLTYIGTAAAIGEPINIPLIIRALAADYYQHGREQLRIVWDDEFLLSLDAGTGKDDPTAIVESYLYAWWEEEPDGRDDNII